MFDFGIREAALLPGGGWVVYVRCDCAGPQNWLAIHSYHLKIVEETGS